MSEGGVGLAAVLAEHRSRLLHDPSKHDNGRSLVIGLACSRECGWTTHDKHAAEALHAAHLTDVVLDHLAAKASEAAVVEALRSEVAVTKQALEHMRPEPAGEKPVTPGPSSPEWSAWATLANEVTAALRRGGIWAMPSRRRRLAGHLWEAGYRPTPAQIVEERARQNRPEKPRTAPESDRGGLSDHLGARDDEESASE